MSACGFAAAGTSLGTALRCEFDSCGCVLSPLSVGDSSGEVARSVAANSWGISRGGPGSQTQYVARLTISLSGHRGIYRAQLFCRTVLRPRRNCHPHTCRACKASDAKHVTRPNNDSSMAWCRAAARNVTTCFTCKTHGFPSAALRRIGSWDPGAPRAGTRANLCCGIWRRHGTGALSIP